MRQLSNGRAMTVPITFAATCIVGNLQQAPSLGAVVQRSSAVYQSSLESKRPLVTFCFKILECLSLSELRHKL